MSNNPTYRLRAGDTLATVARRHGLRLTDLTALNPKINPHAARPGAAIKLPSLRTSGTGAIAVNPVPVAPAPATAAPMPDIIAMIDDTPAPAGTPMMAKEPPRIEVAALEIAVADQALAPASETDQALAPGSWADQALAPALETDQALAPGSETDQALAPCSWADQALAPGLLSSAADAAIPIPTEPMEPAPALLVCNFVPNSDAPPDLHIR